MTKYEFMPDAIKKQLWEQKVSSPEIVDTQTMQSMAEKNRKSKKREAYDDAFKVKVIREYLDTGENISSLATRFNISVSALYSWLSNFGIETSPTNILSSMSKSNADLIKEMAELKRALEINL